MGNGGKEPKTSTWVVALVVFLGLLATSLAIAAEGTKAAGYTYLKDVTGSFHCNYPKNPATILAFFAAFESLLAIVWIHFHIGWLIYSKEPKYVPSRYDFLVHILLSLAWMMFIVSFTLLIYGGVKNGFQGNSVSSSLKDLACPLSKQGIFSAAAICIFLCFLFSLFYYIVGTTVKQEAWRFATSRSPPTETEMGSQASEDIRPSKLSTVPEEASESV